MPVNTPHGVGPGTQLDKALIESAFVILDLNDKRASARGSFGGGGEGTGLGLGDGLGLGNGDGCGSGDGGSGDGASGEGGSGEGGSGDGSESGEGAGSGDNGSGDGPGFGEGLSAGSGSGPSPPPGVGEMSCLSFEGAANSCAVAAVASSKIARKRCLGSFILTGRAKREHTFK